MTVLTTGQTKETGTPLVLVAQNKSQPKCPAAAARIAELVARRMPRWSQTNNRTVYTKVLIGKFQNRPQNNYSRAPMCARGITVGMGALWSTKKGLPHKCRVPKWPKTRAPVTCTAAPGAAPFKDLICIYETRSAASEKKKRSKGT